MTPLSDRQPSEAAEATSYAGLLTEVTAHPVDPDYQVMADRARTTGISRQGSPHVIGAVVVLVFGAMLAVSALRTEQGKPAATAERDQLVAQIHARQHRLDALQAQSFQLESQVARLQTQGAEDRTLQAQADASLAELAALSGAAEVSGPGLRIVTDNAPGAAGSPTGGVILDSDLQALVNALWNAGAEAIAINGNRLTSLTAIRFAGRAITVNYRSLMPPYVIEAIGDPETLPARLLETSGGRAWLGLRQNFGISFDPQPVNTLVLPGETRLSLRLAEPVPVP